jgi:HAD superfamily hydrolase (TIGR01549 family)
MMTRAVLFDLDDTLFDHQGCARDALTAVQQSHEALRSMPFDALARAHAGFLEALHQEVMLGRVALEDARIERFRRVLVAAGADAPNELASELASIYRDTYRTRRRAVAGAAALMAEIRRAARVGIVSNNLLDEQEEKLRVSGLDIFVDALVVSEEAQVSKPDPAIFRIALDRLDVGPSEAVMVGDSWAADVEGARAAGIRAIWFNPSGAPAPDPHPDVYQLKTFEPVDTAARVILEPHRR